MNYLPTNFLSPVEADRGGDAIRGMHSWCMVIRSKGPEGMDARSMRGRGTTSDRKTEDDVRKREGGGMKRDEQTKRRRKVYISGHYFLQYFNVKSSGFLEPWYRFLQEKPSGRSGRGCSGTKGVHSEERGGGEDGSSARSFSCDAIFERRAASLRRGGGSRTIAPPPLRFSPFPRCFFLSPFALLIVSSRSLSFSLSYAQPAACAFAFLIS